MKWVELTHARYYVNLADRVVCTEMLLGTACATREDNEDNQHEARVQGYTGEDAVWRSLVEHELLHSLIAEWVGMTPSLVLTHEAGITYVPYGMRLYEESMVIAFQRYRNTQEIWPALLQYQERLPRWMSRFTDAWYFLQ